MILGIFRLVDDRSPYQLDCMAQPGRDVNSLSTAAVDTRSPMAANTGVQCSGGALLATSATLAMEQRARAERDDHIAHNKPRRAAWGFRLFPPLHSLLYVLSFTINDGLH